MFTKVIGKIIKNMALELSTWQMKTFISVCFQMENLMDLAGINGQMEMSTSDFGKTD